MRPPIGKTLLIGLCLPSARLLSQAAYSIDLAESDEPELSTFGWNALHTEGIRRLRNRAMVFLDEESQALDQSEPLEAARATRIFDIYRQARDLIESLVVYYDLAFGDTLDVPAPCLLKAGLEDLHSVLRRVREAELIAQLRRDALGRAGLHPSVPHRLRIARGGLEWAIVNQASIGERLTLGLQEPQAVFAALKGDIFLALNRLNCMGALAYRQDASHRGRYNIELLEGHQPSIGIRSLPSAKKIHTPPQAVVLPSKY